MELCTLKVLLRFSIVGYRSLGRPARWADQGCFTHAPHVWQPASRMPRMSGSLQVAASSCQIELRAAEMTQITARSVVLITLSLPPRGRMLAQAPAWWLVCA